MGSLADKLKKTTRDANGQLAEQSPEEVQSLASKAGLASAPLTPMGTAAIGGNEHQQKMAGAPNQKMAALSMSMQPGMDLATATRQGQVRSQATAPEQATQQKGQDLQALGGVGDRVNDLINAQRSRLASAAPVEAQAVDQFNGRDLSSIKPLLAQLRSNPGDMNLQLAVNKELGYDISRQLSPDEINSLYESSVNTITKGANGNIDHDLTVTDLINNGSMGYDAPTLAHLLGVPEEQLSTMTVAQLRNQVNQVQANEFSKSAETDQAQQSTQLGTAERQLAHQAGMENARVGTRSSEADVQKVEQAIANGDQVQFGGKSYTVEDLLSDSNISDIISNYMNSAPGSPGRTQLEQSEPELIKFIQGNQAVLHDAAERLSRGATDFHGVQEQNKQLLSKLPPNIIEAVLPGGQQMQATTINPSTIPLLAWAQQNPEKAATLASASKEDAKALAQLKSNELDSLQIGVQGGKWEQYLDANRKVDALRAAAEHATNPDEIVNMVFGSSYQGGYGQLQHDYAAERANAALGLPNSYSKFNTLTGANGKLATPEELISPFLQSKHNTIQDAVAGHINAPGIRAGINPTNPATMNAGDRKVAQALTEKLADGLLTRDELLASTAAFTNDEIRGLEDRLKQVDSSGLAQLETGAGGMKESLESRITERETARRNAESKARDTARIAEIQKKMADMQNVMDVNEKYKTAYAGPMGDLRQELSNLQNGLSRYG